MGSARSRKVWADLWHNRTRSALVVLSIAVGALAIGVVIGAYDLLAPSLDADFLSASPAQAVLTLQPFDEDFVRSVRRNPAVGEAEGRGHLRVRVRAAGAGERATWREIDLYAIGDYAGQRVSQVRLDAGAWPPAKQELLIERSSALYTGLAAGDDLLVELSDGEQRTLRVSGQAHDVTRFPSRFSDTLYGFISLDTYEWLGQPRAYNELYVVAPGPLPTRAGAETLALLVADKAEKSDLSVYGRRVPPPGEHPLGYAIQAMLVVLGTLAAFALFLGASLVVNTITAVLTQHTRQIGVLKAIGSSAWQVARMYLALVLAFGVLAMLLAAPLSVLATRALTVYVSGLLNFSIAEFAIAPRALIIQAIVALLVPLLAALYPVLHATRLSVRSAIHDYGIGDGPSAPASARAAGGSAAQSGWRAFRPLNAVRGLVPRPLALSLGNTFRRRGRTALTLATLTLAGALFVGVFSVRTSTQLTVEDFARLWSADITVSFHEAYRAERIAAVAEAVPGISRVEGWSTGAGRIVRADGAKGASLALMAPPAGSALLQPPMQAGRPPAADDLGAVLIGANLLEAEPGLHLDGELAVDIDGREHHWRIVGVYKTLGDVGPSVVYVDYPSLARAVGETGRVRSVRVVTDQHSDGAQASAARALEAALKESGLKVSSMETGSQFRASIQSSFDILIVFLLIMAALMALVGTLGLTGTMSINVLERTREIAIMRAIGASDGAIMGMVIFEGTLIGLLSWFAGLLVALPISRVLARRVGEAFVQAPLPDAFSIEGALIWLGLVLALSALASYVPARGAARVTIREALAYE